MICEQTGKQQYPSEPSALKALRNIRLVNRKHRKRSNKIPCRAYPCPHCHGWHLTSSREVMKRLHPRGRKAG